MKMLSAIPPPTLSFDEDYRVPDELVGQLCRATENMVEDLLDEFLPDERATLAMYCYRKAHLHQTGLLIAGTCDQSTLMRVFGKFLGLAIYAQSRQKAPQSPSSTHNNRSKITLAGFSKVNEVERLGANEVLDELVRT